MSEEIDDSNNVTDKQDLGQTHSKQQSVPFHKHVKCFPKRDHTLGIKQLEGFHMHKEYSLGF